jgi:hypothetical protein
MNPKACAAFTVLVGALIHPSAWADTPSQPIQTSQTVASEQVLTKEALDRVKRHVIASGKRCTYTNKYSHNPFLELPDYWLYLNPDPGPDGHPQWNGHSDTSKGDFNELVVVEKVDNSVYHGVVFRDANAIRLRMSNDASRRTLEQAVRQALRLIDSPSSGHQETPRTPDAQGSTTRPQAVCLS